LLLLLLLLLLLRLVWLLLLQRRCLKSQNPQTPTQGSARTFTLSVLSGPRMASARTTRGTW
jgi:hypothetical protein